MPDNAPISPLRRTDIDPDPIRQFGRWLKDAEKTGQPHPNAMTLATADGQSNPAARIVLLRGLDRRGFVFFTSYDSRKGQDLSENPAAALLFHWPAFNRQVRVEGRVERVSAEESDDYFARRPRGHQLEAHASPQSRVITDRAFLEKQFTAVGEKFEGQAVPRPQNWGGYRVIPETIELWQEREDRLHDRIRYRRAAAGAWKTERLAP